VQLAAGPGRPDLRGDAALLAEGSRAQWTMEGASGETGCKMIVSSEMQSSKATDYHE
jgi:hypothetical protein